jgi:hypothetical protein
MVSPGKENNADYRDAELSAELTTRSRMNIKQSGPKFFSWIKILAFNGSSEHGMNIQLNQCF